MFFGLGAAGLVTYSYTVGLCPIGGAGPSGELGPSQFAALCTRMPGARTPQQWEHVVQFGGHRLSEGFFRHQGAIST